MAEEGAEKEAAAAAPEPKKGGKGKLVLVLALVVLLAGGGGAAWYLGFLGGGTQAEAKGEGDHGGRHGGDGDGAPKPDIGALVALEPFIANLSDDDGKRYLKAAMQVEFFDPQAPKEFEVRTPQIRDLLLTLLTSKTFAEIRTPEGKSVLRDEIINRINRVLHRDVVKAVYFTEFIVQ